MTWIPDNLPLIGELALVHVRHSVLPLLLALAVSLPLGWLAWRFQAVRGLIVSGTGLLYTIPSLALLFVLPTLLGISALSEVNLIIALTLYGLALLVRAVVDGLDSVDAETRLAATAMGYGPLRRLITVDFPLAGPVILAGARVASVSTIALATVGILVGVTNLGYLFTNGFQRRIVEEILAGLGAVALIAVVVDLLLVAAGRLLLPWTRVPASQGAAS
ncbi:ABC transporter permease subunit [Zhihengliuella somnathii]